MLYLILAIVGSAMLSVFMRLSTDKVKSNFGMLAMNYVACIIIAMIDTGVDNLFPAVPTLPATLGMGAINGFLYLLAFVLLQRSVKENGVVLSSTFMKLGLLVSIAVSVIFFKEVPQLLQIAGFCLAVFAIILINQDGSKSGGNFTPLLIFLLLAGGIGDSMAKVYEQLGDFSLNGQYFLYTFLTALLMCLAVVAVKKQMPGKWEVLFGFMVGIPNYFSSRFLLESMNVLPAVIVYPTYSVGSILLVTLVGVLVFKEKLNKRQWVALGIIITALALLNL